MQTYAIHGGYRRFAKLDQAASTAEGTRVTQVCQAHSFVSEHEAQVALALCDNDAHRAVRRLRSYSFLLKVRKVSQNPQCVMKMRFVRARTLER